MEMRFLYAFLFLCTHSIFGDIYKYICRLHSEIHVHVITKWSTLQSWLKSENICLLISKIVVQTYQRFLKLLVILQITIAIAYKKIKPTHQVENHKKEGERNASVTETLTKKIEELQLTWKN